MKKYYRGGGEGMDSPPRGASVWDLVVFEREELGNLESITPLFAEETLRKIPASRTQWLARTRKGAAYYGRVEVFTYLDPVELVADNQDGYIVIERSAFDYYTSGERSSNPPSYQDAATSGDEVLFIGDTHSRAELVEAALDLADGGRVIFLGDIFDGVRGAEGSVECLRLIREAPNAQLILGNHEAYPIFSYTKRDLDAYWGVDIFDPLCDPQDIADSERVWEEWLDLKSLMSTEELDWLRRQPLYIQGRGWIAAHAKVPNGPLPPAYVAGNITPAQVQMLDHTEIPASGLFWAERSDGRHGYTIVGHTRLPKINRWSWPNCILLDWDAKRAGTAAYAIWSGGKVVEAGGLRG